VSDDRTMDGPHHEQEVADRALREVFAGQPRPELPPFFEYRCASRARRSPSARPLGARERLIMRAYWAAVTLIMCGVILARTDWPSEVSPIVATGALLSTATTAVPVLFFAHLRGGLFALMRRSMG
jgi:hypothetical protein